MRGRSPRANGAFGSRSLGARMAPGSVIGRQPETVSEEEVKRIAGDIPSFVQVQTYDDIFRKMRQMVELKEV